MGLDIYTVERASQEASDAFDKAHPESWYEQATEEQRSEAYRKQSELWDRKDVPSEKFPDNINNRRYLRSSYNAGGFNRVVPEVLNDPDTTYYDVFQPLGAGDQYELKVDDLDKVAECRRRAEQIVERLAEAMTKPVYRTDSVRAGSLRPDLLEGGKQPDAPAALQMFLDVKGEHEEKPNPWGGSFGNAHGSFYLDDEGLKVVAAIGGTDVLGGPCVHLVYETTLHPSYYESAVVLTEFCDELAMLVKRDGCCYINWSG